jgi:Na+-transporting methylmalonyl-CoA/oxaloacetate decarboxylase beta subunit
MKKTLQILVIVIAIVMVYLGIANSMLPPALTGLGLILILALLKHQKTDGAN